MIARNKPQKHVKVLIILNFSNLSYWIVSCNSQVSQKNDCWQIFLMLVPASTVVQKKNLKNPEAYISHNATHNASFVSATLSDSVQVIIHSLSL